MPITKEQVGDLKSCIDELVRCELNFKSAEQQLRQAKGNVEYQLAQALLDKK